MFGQNQPRGPDEHPALQVAEIFDTIQGEGPFAGRPAVFVRLTGCNLRCWFCDTTWGDDTDPRLTPQEIVQRVEDVADRRTTLVVITGGEPLRQPLGDLIAELGHAGYEVQVETAGTYWQDCLNLSHVTTVISPKTSRVHREFVDRAVNMHWKYVVRAGELSEDGFPSAPMQRHIKKPDERNGGAPFVPARGDLRNDNLFFQPMDEYHADGSRNEEAVKANIAEMVNAVRLAGGRAGLQLHKVFDLP